MSERWAALTKAEQIPNWGPFMADRDLTTTRTVRLSHIDAPEAGERQGYVLEVNALKYGWQELYEQYLKQFRKK